MLIDIGDTVTIADTVIIGATDSYGCEWYWLDIDGWGPVASTVTAVQKAAGDGGFATPAFLVPRVVTVTGSVIAPDRPNMVAALDRLAGAAAIAVTNVDVRVGGANRTILGQRQGEITFKDQSDTCTEFTVQFLAVDPRKFGDALTTSTGLASASGGLTIPFTVPFSINSTVVSGVCSLANVGNSLGKVTLRVDGPVTGPVITHVGSGAQLVFASSYMLPSGNWLDIDMDQHTVLENGQAGRNGWVTSRGWSSFEPGMNVWAFTALAGSGLVTVTATPAWL